MYGLQYYISLRGGSECRCTSDIFAATQYGHANPPNTCATSNITENGTTKFMGASWVNALYLTTPTTDANGYVGCYTDSPYHTLGITKSASPTWVTWSACRAWAISQNCL